MSAEAEPFALAGLGLEVLRRGSGRMLLLLHGLETVPRDARFVELLSRRYEIVAPSSPGFGRSPRPDDFTTVYDLVHLYLDIIERLGRDRLTLMGLSFGGWLAAEIAAASCHRLEKLVLVDAFGIKLSDRETPDILDLFNAHPKEVLKRRWRDPSGRAPDFDAMTDEAIVAFARSREALCLYGWQPYMYNPQLKRWLARIRIPTLVLWGADDGIVAPSYGRAYSALIPGARFEIIDNAGHHPEIERPEAFVDAVLGFLES